MHRKKKAKTDKFKEDVLYLLVKNDQTLCTRDEQARLRKSQFRKF
jgi:hypothetical protein